ncbi:hypothetical protein AGMMS49944_26340 [Spirochaetia bacterium]|nr:hypothetical protein AGMMS49944_26340 [Spirochaetia bacterium]
MKRNRKGSGAFGTKAMLMAGMLAAALAFGLVLAGCDPGGGDDDRSAADILGAMVDRLDSATVGDWTDWYADKSFTAKEKQNLYNYLNEHLGEANEETQNFWMDLFDEWGFFEEGGEGTDPTPPGGETLDGTRYEAGTGTVTQLFFSGPGTFTLAKLRSGDMVVYIEGTYTKNGNNLTFTTTEFGDADQDTYRSFTGTLSADYATLTLSLGETLTRPSGGH